jgi:hypothetical protein
MTTLTADRVDRLARRAQFGLTVAIVLGAVEIARRSPKWLVVGVGLLVYMTLLVVLAYIWWIVGALLGVIAWKLGRGFVAGWRTSA